MIIIPGFISSSSLVIGRDQIINGPQIMIVSGAVLRSLGKLHQLDDMQMRHGRAAVQRKRWQQPGQDTAFRRHIKIRILSPSAQILPDSGPEIPFHSDRSVYGPNSRSADLVRRFRSHSKAGLHPAYISRLLQHPADRAAHKIKVISIHGPVIRLLELPVLLDAQPKLLADRFKGLRIWQPCPGQIPLDIHPVDARDPGKFIIRIPAGP